MACKALWRMKLSPTRELRLARLHYETALFCRFRASVRRAHRHTSNHAIRLLRGHSDRSNQFGDSAPLPASLMLPWYQQARVLRKLTVTATGLTAFVCVLHADYGEKPHAFSWLQSYYRAEVVEPLRRQYARLTKKDE